MTLATKIDNGMIENAVRKVSEKLVDTPCNGNDWTNCTEHDLWVELVSCILGSQVKYETAKACTQHLENSGLLNVRYILEGADSEFQISMELDKPIYPPFRYGSGSRYRYHKSKSSMIIKTAESLYEVNQLTLKKILLSARNEFDARDLLVDICCGIGMKQASLFLRNINYAKELAILDSHVIGFMSKMNLFRCDKSFTKRRYLHAESVLRKYANSLNKEPASLDVAIWVVMKVAKEEFQWA